MEYSLKVGAGRGRIAFHPEFLPRSARETYTRILDNPCVRIVLIEGEERYAFVASELANMDRDVQTRILTQVQERAGVDSKRIFFHMNHVHSTPHGWPPFGRDALPQQELDKMEPFYSAITLAAEQALEQALATLREAVIGVGRGICRSCIVNRNVETIDGWWLGSGEEGVVDDSIGIVRFDDRAGGTIAILYVYNVVPSIFDYSTRDFEPGLERTVSADLAGYASAYVEAEFPGAVALYCTGAAGDTWPAYTAMYNVLGRGKRLRTKDLGERALALAELQGDRLGQQVVLAADEIACGPLTGPVSMTFSSISFDGRNEDCAPQEMHALRSWSVTPCGETRTTEIPYFRLGREAVFVGLHCQTGVRTLKRIQEQSPFPVTGVLSFTTVGEQKGGNVRKYVPEMDAYERAEYCAQNSVVMPGSAERLGDHILECLKKNFEKGTAEK